MHGGAKQYFHDEVGFNSRLDALQAVVLSAKLPHLAEWSAKRRQNAAYYSAALADIAGLTVPYIDSGERVDLQPVHDPHATGATSCRRSSRSSQIGTSIYYPLPLHLQPCFAYLGYRKGSCPESERGRARRSCRCRSIRSSTQAQLDEVIAGVRRFYGR